MAETLEFSSPMPLLADTRKVFRHEVCLQGFVPLASLRRLCGSLTDNEGSVQAELKFRFDEDRRRRIEGRVQASVNVQCQRCLEPVRIQLADDVNLALVNSEALAKALPVEIDPWLSEEETLNPADIIEEQLILSMPIVSTHEQCDATIVHDVLEQGVGLEHSDQTEEKQAANPFSVLASLKKKPDTH